MSYNSSSDCGCTSNSSGTVTANQIQLIVNTPVKYPAKQPKRPPFMVAWDCGLAARSGYMPGSLVIHENSYWYNLNQAYAPPGKDNNWNRLSILTLLQLIDPTLKGETVGLAVPVYAAPPTCTSVNIPGVHKPTPSTCNIKFFAKDSLVAGSDGKLYYALHDNTATYPPSADWGGGKTIDELLVKLLKAG